MSAEQITTTPGLQLVQARSEASPLSIDQVVSSLQLLLAVRRGARNEDLARRNAPVRRAVA